MPLLIPTTFRTEPRPANQASLASPLGSSCSRSDGFRAQGRCACLLRENPGSGAICGHTTHFVPGHKRAGITKHPANDQGRMESWEAIAISQALRLGQFWHACNMPLTAHRHVNGKPLKIGINWRKFVPFHPLDLQKTVLFLSMAYLLLSLVFIKGWFGLVWEVSW